MRWINGGAGSAPLLAVDLAVMTGNVAQVFVTDADWQRALAALGGAVRGGGWLVFEAREPAQRAWETWTRELTHRELDAPGIGKVITWTELVDVREPLVSFRHVFRFEHDGSELTSGSTIRFRDREELAEDLKDAGFRLRAVRDAPDRPGLEMVLLAELETSRRG